MMVETGHRLSRDRHHAVQAIDGQDGRSGAYGLVVGILALVFTFVWAFDVPEDQAFVNECAMPFRERGARVLFVELEASQAKRLKRNECGSRLAEKPSKRTLRRPGAACSKTTHGTSSTPAGNSTSARTTCASTTRS
jgi:hypothetical protein